VSAKQQSSTGAAGKPAMTFDVSLSSPFFREGVKAVGQAAMLAEELGFYAVQIGEHMAVPLREGDASTAPVEGAGKGKPTSGPLPLAWYDPGIMAAHLLTKTKRLRLIFNALIVPFRPPMPAAKALATLDVVSGGRLIAGMGSGWMEGEFDALGVPFHERGAITDEYIRTMKVLWTQDRASFSGKYVNFHDIAFYPKCVQKPHIPVWICGTGPRALRRVVEMGDGWSPNDGTPQQLKEQMAWIKEQAQAKGRDPSKISLAFSLGLGAIPEGVVYQGGRKYFPAEPADTPEKAIDLIGRYKDAGVGHLSIRSYWTTPKEFMNNMEWFAAKVMPAFAKREPIKR